MSDEIDFSLLPIFPSVRFARDTERVDYYRDGSYALVNKSDQSEPGAYEKRIGQDGCEIVTGLCAGCCREVQPDDHSVVRYHSTERGGLFHARCAPPAEAGWYSLDDGEGAEDL